MNSWDPDFGMAGTGDVIGNAGGAVGTVLRSLLTRSDLGIAVWDVDLRCVWANDSLERFDGITLDQRLGRRPGESLASTAVELETVAERVLATGDHVVGREYTVPACTRDRHDRALSASFLRLEDVEGRPLGVSLLVLALRDRRWTGDRLAVISEAGARIGTTLDVMRTAQELADFTVPLLADYVTVDLTEAVRLGEEPLERLGPSDGRIPTFRRAGISSIHADAPESLWANGEVVYVPETSPFTQVLSTGRPLRQSQLDTSHGTWLDNDPARAEKIREHGMHSLLILPVHARGVLLGVAVFVRMENPAPFDESDQLLAEELLARAALSLDNARRYARERTAALVLQRSLLPRRIHGGTAMEVAARYLPADAGYSAGGDWFDVIGLPHGRLGLVVGDVVGHGIDAAATMGRLRTAIRTLADLDLPPAELLTRLDRTFMRLVEDEENDTPVRPLSATCVYTVYDPATRTCSVALAGHPPPALVGPGGDVTFPDLPHGTPLGIGLLPYESAEIDLPADSLIALYTDGLVENRHEDISLGMERIRHTLAQTALSLEELCTSVINTLPGTAPADDVTLLLARGL
ncbi:serine phosphatase RsbU (regulator of sigma subunit) [Streptomyces sp. T12]|uniref:SpoIIE family protein phosphatase n=1 Tax=Streptomyces sp. T12 TaxID=477697 RepID=UPI0011AD90ED|nr:SpoIIE family protein phosphatase [Streptomyces sp. T12]TWD13522.1 serine phosphatase RsbU (regulator of sigma subunit) [Streptomyces sp. T12]